MLAESASSPEAAAYSGCDLEKNLSIHSHSGQLSLCEQSQQTAPSGLTTNLCREELPTRSASLPTLTAVAQDLFPHSAPLQSASLKGIFPGPWGSGLNFPEFPGESGQGKMAREGPRSKVKE